jgi:hypothetical protein
MKLLDLDDPHPFRESESYSAVYGVLELPLLSIEGLEVFGSGCVDGEEVGRGLKFNRGELLAGQLQVPELPQDQAENWTDSAN